MTLSSLEMVEHIASALGDLRQRLVFVGGCVSGLLMTDPAVSSIRPTLDVDLVADVVDRPAYRLLEKGLDERGFRPDERPGAPLCRWRLGELAVDIMPVSPHLLGFTNRWYGEAVRTARPTALPNGATILLIDPVCFLATKIEAYRSRGGNDPTSSHDIEDVVSVVDARPEIVQELERSAPEVKRYLAVQIGAFLDDDRFSAALPGHLSPDAASQARLPIIRRRLSALAGRPPGTSRL